MIEKEQISVYEKWQNDWPLFAKDVLKVRLDPEQKEILRAIQTNKMVAVAAGTARGKDFVGAVAALCFLYLTPKFNANGELIENTKVALTGPTSRQVQNIMYPEISRLFNNAKVLPGRLVGTDIRTDWEEWFLTGFKADDTNQEAWSGFHAVNTMFVVTEASGISETTFSAIEGNLQGNSKMLCIFNPNTSIGYAARAMSSQRWKSFRLDDLNAPNVKAKKIIIPGQVDYEWVKDKVETWCQPIIKNEFDEGKGDFKWKNEETKKFDYYRPNDLFRVKVRGMFPEVSEDILIPYRWIELANERWQRVKELGLIKSVPKQFGVDVAGMGTDSSVICEKMGDFVVQFDQHQSSGKADQMQTTGEVKNKLIKNPRSQAFIDTIGEGAGVYSRFVEQGMKNRVFSCKASESATNLTDITGIHEFVNMRAYMYWAVRDWLNPINETGACLPPNSKLALECREIRYMVLSNGKIQIEAKEDIRKRLGFSTDYFDSLALCFYPHTKNNKMNAFKLLSYLR
jgi:hypothetical protein